MSLDVIKCHSEDRKECRNSRKKMKSGRKSRGKSIAKPPDYADRRELKFLSYLGI